MHSYFDEIYLRKEKPQTAEEGKHEDVERDNIKTDLTNIEDAIAEITKGMAHLTRLRKSLT